MDNKVHKEIELQSTLKVVVSKIYSKFNGQADIESAIAAIGYAGKQVLRLRDSVTGVGTILGSVMVLDLNIPLESTNSSDMKAREEEFNRKVVDYLMHGVTHLTSGKRFGGFGRLNVGYVSPNPTQVLSLTIETEKDAATVRKAVSRLGRIIE